jgi:hypothetical protein
MKKIFFLMSLFSLSNSSFSQTSFKEIFETVLSNPNIETSFSRVNDLFGGIPKREKMSDDRQATTYEYELSEKEKILFVKTRSNVYSMVYFLFPNTDEYANYVIKKLDNKFRYTKDNVWINLNDKLMYSIKFDGAVSILVIQTMNI